jgi:hypothetical protein
MGGVMSVIHLIRRTRSLLNWRGLPPVVTVNEVVFFSAIWFDGTHILAERRAEIRVVWGEL